jgi:hypothetical protein
MISEGEQKGLGEKFGEGGREFPVLKVLSQRPFVLLIEVRKRKGKVLGIGMGNILGSEPCYERRRDEDG